MNQRQQRLHQKWLAQYPWHERYRCCDHQYSAQDAPSVDDLAELRSLLLARDTEALPGHMVLYLRNQAVGELHLNLLAVFDALCEELRYGRTPVGDDPHRRLRDEEISAPMSDAEIDAAVLQTARFQAELWEHGDFLDDIHEEANVIADAVASGASATVRFVREAGPSFELFYSKRLRRAFEAIAFANSIQKDCADNPGREKDFDDRPEYLQPVGVSTATLLRTLAQTVSRKSGHCRVGRPRKADPAHLRRRLKAVRNELSELHKRASRLNRTGLAVAAVVSREFPQSFERFERFDLVTALFPDGPFVTTLEDMAAQIVAKEEDISPSTVKRYARSRALLEQHA